MVPNIIEININSTNDHSLPTDFHQRGNNQNLVLYDLIENY